MVSGESIQYQIRPSFEAGFHGQTFHCPRLVKKNTAIGWSPTVGRPSMDPLFEERFKKAEIEEMVRNLIVEKLDNVEYDGTD